jgi:phage-related protein
MKDELNFTATPEARDEIRAFGGDVAARIGEKQRHIKAIGWAEALRLEIVKQLPRIDRDIYEIVIRGKGEAYRVLCFPTGDERGRLIVLTSCVTKGMVLTQRKLVKHVERAAKRRTDWIQRDRERRS